MSYQYICKLPLWEHDIYWEILSVLHGRGFIDLNFIPLRLKRYTLKDIKFVLKYLEEEDSSVVRVNGDKWVIV